MALAPAVRRNTIVLSAATALNWSVIVLVASLTTLTVGHFFGRPELAGLVFGLFLFAYAAGGLLFGRLIDAVGRRNGLLVAFAVGAAGALVVYQGIASSSAALFMAGLLIVGLGTGGANLTRVAGADMHPPARRARGIALVLIGAAIGAIGSPIVFGPVLAGARTFEPAALAAPWPIAAGLMVAGVLVLLAIRVDPRRISEQIGAADEPAFEGSPARPLLTLFAQPMVPLALLALVVSQAVMTATMAMAGLIMTDHGHDLGSVSLTISVHFVGMFGLVLVVGRLVERIGRFRSVVVGLLVLAGGVVALLPTVELFNYVPAMFAVGVGWNIAFVASTTILADASRSNERGRMLGTSDFIALCGAAALSVVAGLILTVVGLAALIIVGVLLALVPAVLIALNRRRLEGSAAA